MPISLAEYTSMCDKKEIRDEDIVNLKNLGNALQQLYSAHIMLGIGPGFDEKYSEKLMKQSYKGNEAKYYLTNEPKYLNEDKWNNGIKAIGDLIAFFSSDESMMEFAKIATSSPKNQKIFDEFFSGFEVLKRVYKFEVPLDEWKQKMEVEKKKILGAREEQTQKLINAKLKKLRGTMNAKDLTGQGETSGEEEWEMYSEEGTDAPNLDDQNKSIISEKSNKIEDDLIKINENSNKIEDDLILINKNSSKIEEQEDLIELDEDSMELQPKMTRGQLNNALLKPELVNKLKSNSFFNFTSSDEHDALKKAYDKYALSVNNHDSEEKQDQRLEELRIAAEEYVVLKRGTRWNEREDWKPTGTSAGTDRFNAAMDIIKTSRAYFGLREFDLKAHNKVKDVLDKKNASEKADRKEKTYTQELMFFKKALMDVEKNEAPLKKFIKDTPVNNGLLVEDCQRRIERNLASIALDKRRQVKLGTKVAEDISYIIAHVAIDDKLRKEDRTEDYEAELESQAIKVRKSKAFDKIAKECLNDWNKLVEHGVDALKTNGKGIALTFAKEDKYINDRKKQNHKKSDDRSTSEKKETNLITKSNNKDVKNSFKKK